MDDLWPDPMLWTPYDHGLLLGVLLGMFVMWVLLTNKGKPL